MIQNSMTHFIGLKKKKLNCNLRTINIVAKIIKAQISLKLAVARYRMICLVLGKSNTLVYTTVAV